MASEKTKLPPKSFPTILSKLRAMKEQPGSTDGNSSGNTGSRDHPEETHSKSNKNKLDLGSSACSSDLREPRSTPRLAWVGARKDSTFSSVSSLETATRSIGILGRGSSMASLGGSTTPWGKRLKKKKDAEEYAARKAAKQKEDMQAFYKGTPVVDDRATSTEILRFLYEMWEPQLCSSYRPDARITTTCRQDMRSARSLTKTIPRRIARLHRARVVIDTCHQMERRTSLVAVNRPRSARSIT